METGKVRNVPPPITNKKEKEEAHPWAAAASAAEAAATAAYGHAASAAEAAGDAARSARELHTELGRLKEERRLAARSLWTKVWTDASTLQKVGTGTAIVGTVGIVAFATVKVVVAVKANKAAKAAAAEEAFAASLRPMTTEVMVGI